MTPAASLARELELTVADLRVEELAADSGARAKLHGVRKALDRLLEQAERTRPCTR